MMKNMYDEGDENMKKIIGNELLYIFNYIF